MPGPSREERAAHVDGIELDLSIVRLLAEIGGTVASLPAVGDIVVTVAIGGGELTAILSRTPDTPKVTIAVAQLTKHPPDHPTEGGTP